MCMDASEHKPPIYFDLNSGSIMIGEPARNAQFEEMELSGFPADIHSLIDLVDGDSELPSFTNSKNNRYAGRTKEDFLEEGRWLLNLFGRLTERRINRLSRLGLIANATALSSSDRFGSITGFQRELGQERIRLRKAYDHWDAIDVAKHLRSVGIEEGERPTATMINRRAEEGKEEPTYQILVKLMPLSEAQEIAGYPTFQAWNKRKYEELGYVFYLANGRLPRSTDFDVLAEDGQNPPRSAILHTYGEYSAYKTAVQDYMNKRKAIMLHEIKAGLNNGTPRELFEDVTNQDEIIRNAARYKIIKFLFPNNSKVINVKLARYDVIGEEFVAYLVARNPRIESWLIESLARKVCYYPEIFPNGEYLQSLAIDKSSLFDPRNEDQIRILQQLLDEHYLSQSLTEDDDFESAERQILTLMFAGIPLKQIASKFGYKDQRSLDRNFLADLRRKLGAYNNAQLARQAIKAKLVNVTPKRGPSLKPKHRQVLEMLSYGLDKYEIALATQLSPETIENYIYDITSALKTKTRFQCVMEGFKTGNLPLPGESSLLPASSPNN